MGLQPSTVSTIGETVSGVPVRTSLQSVKVSAVSGMSYFFINTVACRLIGLGGQVALGWLLLPNDFGVYAFALSIAMAVGALRNGGVSQFLIQQGHRYTELSGPVSTYAFAFNLLAMGILVAIALSTSLLMFSNELPWMLFYIALSFPLGTPGAIFRSKLSIDRRFGAIALLNFSSAVVWQSSVVVLAFFGYGSFSFVIPLLIQAVYESCAGWFAVQKIPFTLQKLKTEHLRQLLRETRWIMASAGVLSLAVTGDYFMVGLLSDRHTVGTYFFAFQLVVTLSQLFNNGIETVFPPLLQTLNQDTSRQSEAFFKSLRLLLLTSVPVSLGFIYLAPLLIAFLWQSKWDGSATAVQVLATCIPAWSTITSFRTLMEARGVWRTRFLLLTAYGAGGMASAGLGAAWGGVTEIAIAVTGYYVLFAWALVVVGPLLLEIPRSHVTSCILGPVLLGCGCALATSIVALTLPHHTSAAINALETFGIFLALVLSANLILYRTAWKEVLEVVRPSICGHITGFRESLAGLSRDRAGL